MVVDATVLSVIGAVCLQAERLANKRKTE